MEARPGRMAGSTGGQRKCLHPGSLLGCVWSLWSPIMECGSSGLGQRWVSSERAWALL